MVSTLRMAVQYVSKAASCLASLLIIESARCRRRTAFRDLGGKDRDESG
jgi:hypothetical protein